MNTLAPAFNGAKKQLQACFAQPGDEMLRWMSPGRTPSQYIVERWPDWIALMAVQHEFWLRRRSGGEIEQQGVPRPRLVIAREIRRRGVGLLAAAPASRRAADHDPRMVTRYFGELGGVIGAGDYVADAAAPEAVA